MATNAPRGANPVQTPAQQQTISDSAAGKRATKPGLNEEKIRDLAYQKWLAAGCPPGDGVRFWLEAECECAKS